jgi:hypothetical protein
VLVRAKYGLKIACFVRITPSDVRIHPSDVGRALPMLASARKIFINEIAKTTFDQGRTPPL